MTRVYAHWFLYLWLVGLTAACLHDWYYEKPKSVLVGLVNLALSALMAWLVLRILPL